MRKELEDKLNEATSHIHEYVFGGEELVPKATTKCLMKAGIRVFARYLAERCNSFSPPHYELFITDILRDADIKPSEFGFKEE